MSTTSRRLRGALPLCLAATVLGGALVTLPAGDAAAGGGNRGPHSVIFINGDGMGPAHREAARLDQVGFDGELTMDSLPVAGLETTDPRDPRASITDSAAAASAWATGQKTFNGAISVDVDSKPLRTLGQEAKRQGRSTGLVTTAQVTDATPAAFFANTPQRGQQSEIARQYLEVSRPDVILGGGEDFWYPTGTPGAYPDAPPDDPTEASHGDRGNLVQRAAQLGYQYVTDAGQLRAARGGKLLGLFANEEMFQQRPEGAGDEYDPVVPLADMTRSALKVLDKDRDGFFLVVEEEAVDEMSHNNNAPRTLEAMRSLEAAVTVAREYVARHPGTLLVVTGDHECGGLTVEDVDTTDESGTTSPEDGPFPVAKSSKRFVMDWTTTGHTGAPNPVTAEGYRSDQLRGYYPNTHLHTVMRSVLTG
jgi:alkaline phosphatase